MTSRTDSRSSCGLVQAPVIVRARYKRYFDIAVIVLSGILFAPFWLLLCAAIPVAIRLEDRGRVFHAQTRLGLAGRRFELFKFRTMVEQAEKSTGPVWAADNDSRVTRVGRVLRPLHLDEIPQILNVLKGDMSLVGPRPERPELASLLNKEHPGFDQRLRVRPGIAGLAQARRSRYTSARQKHLYDNLYIARMSPLLDMKLLAACFLVSIRVRPFPNGPGPDAAKECQEQETDTRGNSAPYRTGLRRQFGHTASRGDGRP